MLGEIKRYKNTIPFSQRLNDFIIERTKGINYVTFIDLEEVDFNTFKEQTKSLGYMLISENFCENTIFGDKYINIAFRVWHDSIHLELNEDFSPMSECRVAFKQAAELPEDWYFERNLILTEVMAQVAYNDKNNGAFPENQREFTINVLETGLI